ncbi:MAG: hypothetical protein WAT79_06835 [Saprospiraceae bacterium]
MKLFLLLSILSWVNPELSNLRSLYIQSPSDESKANLLLSKIEKIKSVDKVYVGYEGAVKIVLAKFAVNPIKKWNLFTEGKSILEGAINSAPKNSELRYLRLTIQTNVPKFLGYSSQIKEDKNFLEKNVEVIKDVELQTMIRSYLNEKV